MSGPVEVDLGVEARAYLGQCLAEGRTLSHSRLEKPVLRRGRVFTCGPSGAIETGARLDDFQAHIDLRSWVETPP
jgi:hypothetical protein